MKHEINLYEAAELLKALAWTKEKIDAYTDASANYETTADKYIKSDYVGYDLMMDAYEAKEKAEKAVKKCFSTLLALLGVDRKAKYGEDGYAVELSRKMWSINEFFWFAKRNVIELIKTL